MTPSHTVDVQSHNRLLYAAIDDIGEAVRGNDAKAYAALVLHGLILAGIAALITSLGSVYQQATLMERGYGVEALAATLLCFLTSSWHLIDAVSPYRPVRLERRIGSRYARVFFPVDVFDGDDPHGEMSSRLDAMDDRRVRAELIAETLKLADILKHESRQTERGYFFLRCELLAATGFLVVAAVSAL